MGPEKIVHDSFANFYRQPTGAVSTGTKLKLRLKLTAEPAENVEDVYLVLVQNNDGEKRYEMEPSSSQSEKIFQKEINVPHKCQILYYYFILTTQDEEFYYGKNSDGLGGKGEVFAADPLKYDIVVYSSGLTTPHWFKKAAIYQIFTDRFYNGQENNEVLNPKKNSLLHAYWDNDPLYIRDEKGEISRWDFFGGNLAGVRKKLPYLKDLGIDIIYFNPLFKAPSNHKFDTSDYHLIDEMFGDNEEFEKLVRKAEEFDIKIILEGVFNYTGSDSKYFDKKNKYEQKGAYQSQESPYYSWYKFDDYPEGYQKWWGMEALPVVNDRDESFQDYIIYKQNSVLKYWLDKGITGWKLDSFSALSRDFISSFYTEMKEQSGDSVLLGALKTGDKLIGDCETQVFLNGDVDGIFNLEFRENIIKFVIEDRDARQFYRLLMTIKERMPREYFYARVNLLSSHNLSRIYTEIKERFAVVNSDDEFVLKILQQLVVYLFTVPGVPSVFYGDEAGIEGKSDPENRRSFPWGQQKQDVKKIYRKLLAVRNHYDLFTTGDWTPFWLNKNVFGYTRKITENEDVFGQSSENNQALVLFNQSSVEKHSLSFEFVRDHLDLTGEENLYDLTEEKLLPVKENSELKLAPQSSRIILKNRWSKSVLEGRKAGILLHITSLPSDYGIGDLGYNAYKFVDFLQQSGQKYWQILPFNPPVDISPYQCYSSFAGNSLLISPVKLKEEGLITEEELQTDSNFSSKKVNFAEVRKYKKKIFKKAFLRFRKLDSRPEFKDFLEKNQVWLDDYCLFRALKDEFAGAPWNKWPQDIAHREEKAVEYYQEKLQDSIQYYMFLQYIFYKQWQELYNYAQEKGIEIFGDIPIFTAHDSSDVWANPEYFLLTEEGNPSSVAGVPPDAFSDTGQLWGNPLYDWEKLKSENFSWWKQRLSFMENMVDVVRIDHFRGFEAYWKIPAQKETAVEGEWVKAPGQQLFDLVKDEFSELDIIAEDLGYITPEVEDLKNRYNFPGMKVVQFITNPEKEEVALPLYQYNNVFYTGTHDNKTLWQWYQEFYREQNNQVPGKKKEVCWKYIDRVLDSWARIAIIPLQDYLCLGKEARMNKPGTIAGNWEWRFQWQQIPDQLEEKIEKRMVQYKRKEDQA
ncbi:MAG: 4-alpha-glucanotransferase [Bacillota bacterium]